MGKFDKAKEEVKTLSVEVMEALAHTIDAKDEYTRGHSVRVAKYSRMLAERLSLSPEDCENVYYMALLHDIGKAVDQTQEGTHIQLGVEIANRYGEKPEVVHAIEAHHDDVVANTIEAVLVKVADAISAGRPGARRDTLEIYIKRLQKIEETGAPVSSI